ncbi:MULTISPECIES: amino acid permease [Micrococcaceae]|uniref:amino acid permease n=1 Tax=Micrococcaceae TaxID=1268 RepID=UPI001035F127|nr:MULTISPECIES: amino acid permease [Micrococcaceae]TAP25218.1 amino acid permease [Arthrobacter sp. S41]UXN32194.1 amino acid permease [Glutamicibacter sp. M10]
MGKQPVRATDIGSGLKKSLTPAQMSMIALGSAIGTGLFAGSKLAIMMAGPSVILSYVIGGVVALLVMGALAEMTVKQPVAGSFGVYAERYLGRFAGYLTKYLYWSALIFAVGTEVSAVGEYMQYWFPQIPGLWWVAIFSAVLLAVNFSSVKIFGTTEYWFSAIKVFAVLAFIIIALWLVFHNSQDQFGVHNYSAEGGFFANGLFGTWSAVIVAIFSYMGIEAISIAAAEAHNPKIAVRKSFKVSFLRLLLFYVFTMALILAVAPTSELISGGSPFVTVMSQVGIPFADSVLNFVLIIAALSAMNAQLYAATRMLHSLADSGHAPRMAFRTNRSGAPIHAVWMSAGGIGVAAIVYALVPDGGFGIMLSLATFGALATWFMILITHVSFRRRVKKEQVVLEYKLLGYPAASILGALLLAALLATSFFVPQFKYTLIFGVPFVVVMSVLYWVVFARKPKRDTL